MRSDIIRAELGKWYWKVLEEEGRIKGVDHQNNPVEVSIREIAEGSGYYTKIVLTPLTAINDDAERVMLFSEVYEHVYSSGIRHRKGFHRGPAVAWDITKREVFYQRINEMRLLNLAQWFSHGTNVFDRHLDEFSYLSQDAILDDEFDMVIDTRLGTTTIWLNTPNMNPIYWERGRLEINHVLQYGLEFLGNSFVPSKSQIRFKEFVF